MTPWWMEICAAPVAIGFAMVFNVPMRALPYCALLGVAGHGVRWSVLSCGGDIALGTLLGALLIGVGSLLVARWRKDEPTLFSIAAAIPLVPGVALFHALDGLIRIGIDPKSADMSTLLVSTVGYATQAGMLVLALAFGLAAPALMAPRHKTGVPAPSHDDDDDELAAESDRLPVVPRR